MKILITEDDPVNILLLKGILAPLGHEVFTANNGTQARALAAEHTFDLFLFDVMMPGESGFDLTRFCRLDPRHRDVPILLITALSRRQDLLEGFESGASDYIPKPFNGTELLYRVKAHLRARTLQLNMESVMNELNLKMLEIDQNQRALERKEQELEESNRLLSEANQQLLEYASRDTLTGFFNRRKGWDFMNYEEERSLRSRKPIGVALLDLDGFKSINDTLGHNVGDMVLKRVATLVKEALRQTDIAIRWGGEEFLLIFPETEEEGLAMVTERVRSTVAQGPWDLEGGRTITVSIGTELKLPECPWDEAISIADRNMYEAKRKGKNQVVRTLGNAFDLEQMKAQLELEEPVLFQIIQLFADSLPGRKAILTKAWEENDSEGLRKVVHTLKGTAANLAAKRFIRSAEKFEVILRSADKQEMGAAYKAFVQELETLGDAVARYLETASPAQ